jgi:hypothetical protein
MQGAAEDLGAHFASIDDTLRSADGDPEPVSATPGALQVRRSDEEEWEPLLLGAHEK